MRLYYQICLSIIISLFLLKACSKQELRNNTPVNVLLLGSSFTGYYQYMLPDLVNFNNDSINKVSLVIGGGTLEMHTQSHAMKLIRERNWDYILIQESGFSLSLNDSLFQLRTIPFAQMLMDTIYSYNPSARIGFYMPHAYEFGNKVMCEYDSAICTHKGMQKRIINNSIKLSKTFNTDLAPVGYYWNIFSETYPEIDLFNHDEVHQSHNGSYLTACIIYHTMYNKTPLGAPCNKNLSQEVSAIIQEFVHSKVINNNDWNKYYKQVNEE